MRARCTPVAGPVAGRRTRSRRSLESDADGLELAVAIQLDERVLVARAAVLVAAERHADPALLDVVDPDVADLDATGDPVSRGQVVGIDARRQAVANVVHGAEHLGLVTPGHDGQHGTE